MSDPLRIALVVEGPTDSIFLRAAIESLLPNREFEIVDLQPEYSASFELVYPEIGLGWTGVYHWCQQAVKEGNGHLSQAALFKFHDLLVMQVDADVAGTTYENGRIDDPTNDLPCKRDCPPASDTTDALRKVLLRWMGEKRVPDRLVFCTPSKSLETWVVAALFPENRVLPKKGWECHPNPAAQLGQVNIRKRITKCVADYRKKQSAFVAAWPHVCALKPLTEARRFSNEFLAAVDSTVD